ncbi:hypothetical protein HED50_23965 [Ochrobactrum oryzae]|uniref:Acyl-CoA dehydrogenase n=1 Tax=Brucella tritici TaxID=94626 RepID=A0A7X6FSZ8_9HYPH|nr:MULTISPECIES: hypothetical protein [Brucella]MCR5943858.1 hypothetical protein [Ochrobactrum sp. XJ1]NKC23554.1 hypothetical protein [Brucella oryzae]KAB2663283.1 hypothetical protein F9K91_18825 [Brucella tritici]NKW11418.1 hypothetical protein [Brucella tritici]PJO45671.1 hypothetical protein CWE02_23055 [Brucella pituitosa]
MNEITVNLSDDQARAFAEFLKRVLPEDFERRSVDKAEANRMWDAGSEIRRALADKGFSPR